MKTIKQVIQIGVILASCSSLIGCGLRSYSQDNIPVSPSVSATNPQDFKGKRVSVIVMDDRDSNTFGTKVGNYGKGGKISPSNDITSAIKNSLNTSLSAAGAKVVSPSSSTKNLEVKIRSIKYDAYRGLLHGGVTIETIMYARVKRGNQTLYERRFLTSEESAAAHALGGKSQQWNTDHINDSISKTLSKILNDRELRRLLIGG
jgi:uncharacterized lipoprotein YajG